MWIGIEDGFGILCDIVNLFGGVVVFFRLSFLVFFGGCGVIVCVVVFSSLV